MRDARDSTCIRMLEAVDCLVLWYLVMGDSNMEFVAQASHAYIDGIIDTLT